MLLAVRVAAPVAAPAADPSPATAPVPVRIGVLEASGPFAAGLAAGAAAAAAEINAAGGVAGRRVEVVQLSPPRPWQDVGSLIARLAFEKRLVALIGPTDGAGAHVAAQVATRLRIPLVTLSPEESLTQAGDPWIFRGVPDDREQARAVLRWAVQEATGATAVAVIPPGRDGRERVASVRAACRDLGVRLAAVIEAGGVAEAEGRAAPALEAADAVLLWLEPADARSFLEGIGRKPGAGSGSYMIVGSARLDTPDFLRAAAPWAERLALPLLRGVETSPDGGLAAALGYDIVRAIAAAARSAGPEAQGIRDALARGVVTGGRTGTLCFDRHGNRKGLPPVGVLRRGRLVRVPSRDGDHGALDCGGLTPSPAATPGRAR